MRWLARVFPALPPSLLSFLPAATVISLRVPGLSILRICIRIRVRKASTAPTPEFCMPNVHADLLKLQRAAPAQMEFISLFLLGRAFIGAVLNIKAATARVYLPPARHQLLPVHDGALSAGEELCEPHRRQQAAAPVGLYPKLTFEIIAAAALLRKHVPTVRVRLVNNVTDLMILALALSATTRLKRSSRRPPAPRPQSQAQDRLLAARQRPRSRAGRRTQTPSPPFPRSQASTLRVALARKWKIGSPILPPSLHSPSAHSCWYPTDRSNKKHTPSSRVYAGPAKRKLGRTPVPARTDPPRRIAPFYAPSTIARTPEQKKNPDPFSPSSTNRSREIADIPEAGATAAGGALT
ncbi:hypothetical protein DFH06DRAFT_1422201 [Mycena polygramma]|nr:hypothetical protein DFH06DRAFT_1422201 [Mycena polygramma]